MSYTRGKPLEGPRPGWQFAAVALGQVAAGGADLLFDQIQVVEQPFRGRGGVVTGDRGLLAITTGGDAVAVDTHIQQG
jgi:hypothetical protein